MSQGVSGNISFVSASRSPASYPGSSNNTSTCIITKPSGQVAGDLMLAFMIYPYAFTLTPPGGWTLVGTFASGIGSKVYYKFDTGSEGSSYTFTDNTGGATPLCGGIVSYRNVDPASPINVSEIGPDLGSNPSATQSTPAATSTAPSWMLHHVAVGSNTVSPEAGFTGGSGLTSRMQFSNRGSVQWWGAVWDSDLRNRPGSQAGVSFTAGATPYRMVLHQIGLKVNQRPGRPVNSAASVRASL